MKLRQVTLLFLSVQLSLAGAATMSVIAASQTQFERQILNGYCCVPNLSSGYEAKKLKDGEWKGDNESVNVYKLVFGNLDNKPVAVGCMENWTGGSGRFNSLLLYEQQQGRAETVGSYAFGDRAEVLSLSISTGKIKMVYRQTLPGHEEGMKPHTVFLKRSDFDKAECLDYELSQQMKDDLAVMVDLYASASKLTPEQKKQGLDICNRYQTDRALFTRSVRLQLEAGGWGPGPSPLQFDKDGKPSLYVDSKERYPLF